MGGGDSGYHMPKAFPFRKCDQANSLRYRLVAAVPIGNVERCFSWDGLERVRETAGKNLRVGPWRSGEMQSPVNIINLVPAAADLGDLGGSSCFNTL